MKKSSNHNTCLKPSSIFFAKNVIFTCILLVICVIPNFAQGAYYLTVSQLESLSYGDQDTKTDGYFVYESRYIQDIDANQDFLFPVSYHNGSWTGSSDITGSEQHNYIISLTNIWSEFALLNQLQDLSEPLNGNNHNSQGLPVYDLSVEHINAIVPSEELGNTPPTAGKYAIEIMTAGTDQGKYLVRAEQVDSKWQRKMNGTEVVRYNLRSDFADAQAVLSAIGSPPIFSHIVDQTDTPNELTYSGTDGTRVEGNKDKRQHLFDALYAKHIKDNPDPNALENFFPTWLIEEERTYYRQFSESLDSEPKEKREELIIDFVYNMIDENNHFFAFQDLREEISFSIDFNGTVDFSTGRPKDRMVDAIYSISSPHEVEKIRITFRHPNHGNGSRNIDIEINSKTANGIKNFEYSPWFEHNSTTGSLDIVPNVVRIVVNSPDRGLVILNYYSEGDNQFTKLTGLPEDQWPAVKFKNLVDDRQMPELLKMEVIDGVYDYDAPSDGLDIKIHAKDHGGSGIRSIITHFTKEGNDDEPSIEESMHVGFTSGKYIIPRRVHDYQGGISPRLLENRWKEPGTWTLSRLYIEDRTLNKIIYYESELIEILGELPTILIKGSTDEKDPQLIRLPGDKNLDFSWVEVDRYRPSFPTLFFTIEEEKLSRSSYAEFEIRGRFEDTNQDGIIDQRDEEQTSQFSLRLQPDRFDTENNLIAILSNDWFDESILKKVPLDTDKKLKLSSISLGDQSGNHKHYSESELLTLPGIDSESDLLFSIVNFPDLDFTPPKIVKAEIDLKEAKLFLQVDERSEIEEVELELFQEKFGNRWYMFHAGDEDITISAEEEGKWLVELDLRDLLEEFPRDAFTSAFSVNSLMVRDSNGQAEPFNVNDQQSLQNLIFDQSYAGEIDDNHPTLLAVIPSTSVASESTTLSLVFHAPIDIGEGHIGLRNDSHTANLNIHFDLSEDENVVNAWREDNLLVVEVKNLDPHFERDFDSQNPEDKFFYINNYHLEGIHGEHYENHGDPFAGSESESEVPLLFSKPILQIEEPWGVDHEDEEEYENILNVLATDTSIDFGGENGIYSANGGPLRFTLDGFSGIEYSRRVQIELSSMDGNDNVYIQADYQGEETAAPDEHPDIYESLERFRDHHNLSGHASVTKDGKLVIEANRASLSGRYYISEIRFDHGYPKTYDSHDNPTYAHNSIYLIQGFGHFMIEPLPEEDAEEMPVIEKIELSPNFIDIDSEESSEFSITVLGKDITEVEAIFAQSFSPWHNYLDVQMDLNNATPVGEAKVFSTVLEPTVPGIYHLVAISLTNSKGDKISLYDDDLETPMEESPLEEDFPFDIPSLVAKGAFPSVVQMERPQNKDSADELVKKFYANETPPATQGDYEGPIDLDEFHDEQPQTLPPLLKTNSKVNLSKDVATLTAVLLSDGNNSDLELGFQVSDSIFFDNAEEILIYEKLEEESLFSVSLDLTSISARRIYFRAFARNQYFESFGSKKRFRLPEIESSKEVGLFPDAFVLEDGWKENWLGLFHEYPNGWIYHLDLAWCYAAKDETGGLWLWTDSNGWAWTNQITWPHIYINDTSSWVYLVPRVNGPAVIFDYEEGKFFHLE
jgi:hypothetical protein